MVHIFGVIPLTLKHMHCSTKLKNISFITGSFSIWGTPNIQFSHIPELKDEHDIWTPGLDLSVNLTGRSLRENKDVFTFYHVSLICKNLSTPDRPT